MTTLGTAGARLLEPEVGPIAAPQRAGWSLVERTGPVCAVLTVLLRLPAIARPPGPDEAGFLVVAREWSSHGTSLYGSYWVDRPPLLISIFRIAALHGGLVTLRLIGALAAAVTVLGVAHVAGRVARAGGRSPLAPATVAAALASAWFVSPLSGSNEVNGELLAAPLVVWGLAAVVGALDAVASVRRRAALAAAAGACAVGAVLVKQNFADVGVFAVLMVLVALARGELPRAIGGWLALWFVAGATTALSAMAAWAIAHGTSLRGVYWAMYPFRVIAGQVIAASGNEAVSARLTQLGVASVLSGLALVLVGAIWLVLRRRVLRSTVVVALAGEVVFDGASILLGGSYWLHYLVQLVVPLSVLAGVVVSRAPRSAARLVAATVASALFALLASGGLAPSAPLSQGARLGRAVAAASRPGDTIVTLYGHSDVTQQSGLDSPYLYLWSLPLKTLDPQLTRLTAVLSGPDAPTWVVTWAHLTSWGVQSDQAARVVARDYHVAAIVDGHTVYVRNDVQRSTPGPPTGLIAAAAQRP